MSPGTCVTRDEPAQGLVRLTMTQPGKKNAMNASMRETLRSELVEVAANPAIGAVILTGADGDFSAGGDLHGLMQVQKSEFRDYLKHGHQVVRAFWNFEKPAVAAVEGVGVGGGLALAMCCDHIVMGASARIGFTFVKIGFVPDWGTPYTVAQRVGKATAAKLFLSAELVSADEALRIGLVDAVAADAEVQQAAIDTARRLARQPRRAFALTKRIMRTIPDSLDAALEFELSAQENCFKSDEFMEGVKPFLSRHSASK